MTVDIPTFLLWMLMLIGHQDTGCVEICVGSSESLSFSTLT